MNQYSFIILPGFIMNKSQMIHLTKKLKIYYPNSKYIFLEPPYRKITIYRNNKYRSWYDYYTNHCMIEECINTDQLKESRKRIHERILSESKHTPMKHIYLLGYSQGACMALDAGLTFSKKIGGIIGIKGHIIRDTFQSLKVKQNVLVSHGTNDKTIGYDIASKSYDKLKKNKYNITFVKQTTNHSLKTGLNDMINYIRLFIYT